MGFVEGLQHEAAEAIGRMREVALEARTIHARAELMRHMLTTVRKRLDRGRDEAVAFTVDEWLAAWALTRETWSHVAAMEALAGAFYDYARTPGAATDAALRDAAARVEEVFAAAGRPVADEMAWRSSCAHRWWADVRPPPAGAGRADRDWPSAPFWDAGCPAHCL